MGSMNHSEAALACFNNGFNCAQAVLTSCCETVGLDRETALKVAGAFGGGMGRLGEVCGAVSGAFMLIGLKYGKYQIGDNQAREKTDAMAQRFATEFQALHGSLRCADLLGEAPQTPEARQRVAGNMKKVCPELIRDAVTIIEAILNETEPTPGW
jgi:C_GCAxxG_C_C family probable redox protein